MALLIRLSRLIYNIRLASAATLLLALLHSVLVFAQPEINATVDSVDCFGENSGAIFIEPIQGDPPITFVWSTGDSTSALTDLYAGIYVVTITDGNGQMRVDSFIVHQPPPLTGVVVNTQSDCDGLDNGTAYALPSGGTVPYSYQWSDPLMQTTQQADSLARGFYFVTVTDANGCSIVLFTKIFNRLDIDAEASATDANCIGDNGTAQIDDITSENPPFTYSWSTGDTTEIISGLNPGIYAVTITDSIGCQTIETVTVGLDSILSTELLVEHINCDTSVGGSAILTITEGLADYTVIWRDAEGMVIESITGGSNSFSIEDLSAGAYTVEAITADSCMHVIPFEIMTTDSLSVSLTGTPPSCLTCQDGTGLVTVTNGTAPYDYLWNNGLEVNFVDTLGFGFYAVTVTDSLGCIGYDTLFFTMDTFPPNDTLIVVISTDGETCEGVNNGTAQIDTIIGGTPPFSILWDNGSDSLSATGLSSGIHQVSITDASGLVVTRSFFISSASNTLLLEAAVTNADCLLDSTGSITLFVNGGTPPYSYAWESPITVNDSIVTGLTPDFYAVTVTDANGCERDTVVRVNELNPLILSAEVTPDTCARGLGEIAVVATGGQGEYTYEWEPDISDSAQALNLMSGSYRLKVSDDSTNCTADTLINLKDYTLDVQAEVTIRADTCTGGFGSIDITFDKGDVIDYSFLWSPNISDSSRAVGLVSGTYAVTYTHVPTQCPDSLIIDVPDVDPLAIIIVRNVPDTCGQERGLLEVVAVNGSGQYTYEWSFPNNNSALLDSIGPGVYSVTVTDLVWGCMDSLSIQVEDANPFNIQPSITHVECAGENSGSIALKFNDAVPPLTILWSDPVFNGKDSLQHLSAGTYSVTVTDSRSCPDVKMMVVEENPPITIDATIINENCDGDENGRITAAIFGGVPPYTYTWSLSGAPDTAVLDSLSAGLYSLTITDSLGCQDSMAFEVLPAIQPLGDFTWNYDSCSTDSVVIAFAALSLDTLVFDTWQWLVNGKVMGEDSTLKITVYDSMGLDVVLIVGIEECTDTVQKFLTIDPIVFFFPDTLYACIPEGVFLQAGGDTTYLYQWYPAEGLDDFTIASPYAQPDSSMWYYVDVLVAQFGDTCYFTDSVYVQVAPPINLQVPNDTLICSDSVVIHAQAAVDVDFLWHSLDGTLLGTGDSLVVRPMDSSYYVVSVQDTFGCQAMDTVLIVGAALDLTLLDTPIIVCLGDEAGPLLFNHDPQDVLTIDWSPDSLFAMDSLPDPGFSAQEVGVFSIWVDVSNQHGCKFSDTILLQVLDTTADASFLQYVQCDSLQVIFENLQAPLYRLYFDFDGNPAAFTDAITSSYAYESAGTYRVALILDSTFATGCADTLFKDIVVVDSFLYQTGFTITRSTCSDSAVVTLTDTSSHTQDSIVNYIWTVGDSVYSGNPIVINIGDTVVPVQVSLESALGCEYLYTDTIFTPLVQVMLSDTLRICIGDTVGLNPTGDTSYQYFWNPPLFLSDLHAPNPLAWPRDNITYFVSVLNTADSITCEYAGEVSVLVDSLPHVALLTDSVIRLCDNQDTLLTALISGDDLQYAWSLKPDFVNLIGNEVSLLANAQGNRTTTYYLRVTGPTGCEALDSTVIGNYSPVLSYQDTVAICLGDSAFLEIINLVATDTLSYDWQPDSGIVSGDGTSAIVVAPIADAVYLVNTINSFGCSRIDSIWVQVNDFANDIVVSAEPSTIVWGDSSLLSVEVLRSGSYIYEWSPGIYLDDSISQMPFAYPSSNTTFGVVVTDEDGCIGFDSVLVTVDTLPCERPYVFLPNAFTPNDDNVNDVLYVRGRHVDEMYLAIYNRWGQLLFETRDQSEGWDGTFMGELLEPDVFGYYLWVRCLGGELFNEKGNVSILR